MTEECIFVLQKSMGIQVLDHIVVGCNRYVSFVDDGYWTSV